MSADRDKQPKSGDECDASPGRHLENGILMTRRLVDFTHVFCGATVLNP